MDRSDHDLTPEELAAAERGRVLVAAAVQRERAPLGLRERVEAQRHTRRRLQFRALAPILAGAAALLAAMVVVFSGGSGPPTVSAVSLLALRGPALGAPAPRADKPDLLKAQVDGTWFPEWRQLQWPASGMRDDTLEDRHMRTVFYTSKRGARIGYTIVAGKALEVPDGRRTTIGSTQYTVVEDGGRRIVTWRRNGHTCVLSGPASVPADRLLGLASWGAQG